MNSREKLNHMFDSAIYRLFEPEPEQLVQEPEQEAQFEVVESTIHKEGAFCTTCGHEDEGTCWRSNCPN